MTAELLQPLLDGMRMHLLAHQVLCAEKTRRPVLSNPGRQAGSQSYMGVHSSGEFS